MKHVIRGGLFDAECRGFGTMADHMAIAATEKGTATEVLHCIPSNSSPCQPKTVNFVSSPESVFVLKSIERKWIEKRKINVVSSLESLPPLTFTGLNVKCPWRRPEDGEIYRSQRAQSDMVYCSVVELGFAMFILNKVSFCSVPMHNIYIRIIALHEIAKCAMNKQIYINIYIYIN